MKDAEQKIVSPSAETEEHKDTAGSDIEALKAIAEKYDMTVLEKKLIHKIVSLLETEQMRRMLPPQNIGDSVFKMYPSDPEPTEFLVDRIEFDDYGWNLVSYEKFGTSEMEFIFTERDYKQVFFDTAEEARKHNQ
ncbi:MAG: hypothetical protein IIY93_12270 [Clostridia bacterium]|nr:hypothetical protein [Clostridia bacterium]MBQ5545527.1 hypothetical protein [Clostridia bacterium]